MSKIVGLKKIDLVRVSLILTKCNHFLKITRFIENCKKKKKNVFVIIEPIKYIIDVWTKNIFGNYCYMTSNIFARTRIHTLIGFYQINHL